MLGRTTPHIFIALVLGLLSCRNTGGAGASACNPITADDCFLPYPSSYYLKADPSSPTGWRVNIPSSILPKTYKGIPLDTEKYSDRDGFSPASQILAYFAEGVDPSNLPPVRNIGASLTEASPVQVFNMDTGDPVPLFAETDALAKPGQRQAFIIRPMVKLKTSGRYVVVLRTSLRNKSGSPLSMPAPFKALRDGLSAPNESIEGLKPRYEEIFSFLSGVGINRQDVLLSWDFLTASDISLTGRLLAMRDTAFRMMKTTNLGYTVTSVQDFTPTADPNLSREILGWFEAPNYLKPDSSVNTDAGGNPVTLGTAWFPFVIHIPRSVTAALPPTVPIMIFGHGLFGTAQGEMNSTYEKSLINQLGMVQAGTNWIGVSADDKADVAVNVLTDANNFYLVTDKLQQAHLNFQVLTRLVLTRLKNDPSLLGRCLSTTSDNIYYYGISNGGIQGTTFMALSPDVIRGVVGVPGAVWSMMFQRNEIWGDMSLLLTISYPDLLDQQVLLALVQNFFDYTDPINFGPHTVKDPLPGTPLKRMIVQESIGDSQVTNIATETLARTMEIPVMAPQPLTSPIFGIPQVYTSNMSALTLWNVHPVPFPPDTNTSPAPNCAHEEIRRLPALRAQLAEFFTPSGMVVNTCGGACDFPTDNCYYYDNGF